jgi:threonine/homoserine/homoserine lactone efflux protein
MIYLTQGILLGLYASILPGPFQAFMLSQTLRSGWRRTMPLAIVPLLTDLPVMLGLLFLVAQMPGWLLDVLRTAGGVYLLYLGWNTFTGIKTIHPSTPSQNEAGSDGFFKSILINYLNPNVYIFWGAVGVPIILTGLNSTPISGINFILGFYLTVVLMLAVTIFLFGSAGALSLRFRRYMSLFLTVLLIFFGGYMILQSIGNWMA